MTGAPGQQRTRGPNQAPTWQRDPAEGTSTIRLPLDVSDPLARRRVERLFAACFQVRRALQRQARGRIQAFWAAHRLRRRDGPAATRTRFGLSRAALERAAYAHLDAAPHLRRWCTKALAMHLADTVWTACERHLFRDSSGARQGAPKPGRWEEFTRVPGRAKSHTRGRKWETFRLHGSLEGHRRAYTPAGGRFFQPRRMRPVGPAGSWWDHEGPLAVVVTGLEGGEIVLPVRLPPVPSNQAHLDHHLADPSRWHKIDLVRYRDPNTAGGWRYEAHLLVLTRPYESPHTTQRRRLAAEDGATRRGGVDVNVSNVTVASHTTAGEDLRITRVEKTGEQKDAAAQRRLRQRRRQKALDRSRRAANPDQYHRSRRQQKAAERRQAKGLRPKQHTPAGPRQARCDGKPHRAHRLDHLSGGYRRTRGQLAADERSAAQARRELTRTLAGELVATHGPNLVVEDCSLTAWARLWGRSLHTFTPGLLAAALDRETAAVAAHQPGSPARSGLRRAATRITALSQRCLCSAPVAKTLADRTHRCPTCGLEGDRDAVAAILAAQVAVAAGKPATARLDTASAHELLQHPATWHTIAQTVGRQDAPTASTATTPGQSHHHGGWAVERPPATSASSARRIAGTATRPTPDETHPAGTARERAGRRTSMSRNRRANAPP